METAHAPRGTFSQFLDRHFPAPRSLFPPAVGVDISDASVKWLRLSRDGKGNVRVHSYGIEMLNEGAVSRGVIRDQALLAATLSVVSKKAGTIYVHSAMPEEIAYVFPTHVPTKTAHAQARRLI